MSISTRLKHSMNPQVTPPNTRILIGGAGAPNYGDELILKGWLDYLSQPSRGSQAIALHENTVSICRNFHLTKGHPLTKRITFKNNLSLIAKSVQDLTFWEQVERGFNFMRDFGFREIGYKGINELFEASSFHLHGGGYLNDIRSDKGFFLGLVASFRKIYEVPAFGTGIGLGPFKTKCHNPALFDEIMSHFDFFEVRDSEGFELLASLAPSARIINGIDDCFTLPVEQVFRQDSSKRRLHLSLINSHIESYPDSCWDWLREQASRFEEVVFWESYPWNDREVITRVTAELPQCKIITTHDLVHTLPAIGDEDVFITHRFHVHFAAARAGARGFYIAPSLYYKQKHRSIVELGSGLKPLNFKNLPDLDQIPRSKALDEAALHGRKLQLSAKCYPAGRASIPS